jgi:hypothetical protein
VLSHKFLIKLTTQIYNFSENTESLQPLTRKEGLGAVAAAVMSSIDSSMLSGASTQIYNFSETENTESLQPPSRQEGLGAVAAAVMSSIDSSMLSGASTQIDNFSETDNTGSLQPPTRPEGQTNSQFIIMLKSVLDNSFICKSSYFMEDFSASLISISLANIVRLQNSKKYQFE